jgi:DNA replication protein DnaC
VAEWMKWGLDPLKLPERYVEAAPKDIPVEAIRKVTQKYLRNFFEVAPQGVAPAFFGKPELYKTYAAAAIARFVHGQAHWNVEFVNAGSEFLRLGLQRFTAEDRMLQLIAAPFLVLDDITNVTPGGIYEELLTRVVSERFDALKPTLYTGNYDFNRQYEKFEAEYSPLLARRIYRGSTGYRVVITGK